MKYFLFRRAKGNHTIQHLATNGDGQGKTKGFARKGEAFETLLLSTLGIRPAGKSPKLCSGIYCSQSYRNLDFHKQPTSVGFVFCVTFKTSTAHYISHHQNALYCSPSLSRRRLSELRNLRACTVQLGARCCNTTIGLS